MFKIIVLFYFELVFEGVELNVLVGILICEVLLDNGIEIEYVCDMSCVCMICYCIVCKGFDFFNEVEECEDDLFDWVWGLEV